MADNRKLAHGEKAFALFTSEKGRDRANARRSIEGLHQGEQTLAHLAYQSDLLLEQTNMFRYMCDRLVEIERQLHQLNRLAPESPVDQGPPPPPPPPT